MRISNRSDATGETVKPTSPCLKILTASCLRFQVLRWRSFSLSVWSFQWMPYCFPEGHLSWDPVVDQTFGSLPFHWFGKRGFPSKCGHVDPILIIPGLSRGGCPWVQPGIITFGEKHLPIRQLGLIIIGSTLRTSSYHLCFFPYPHRCRAKKTGVVGPKSRGDGWLKTSSASRPADSFLQRDVGKPARALKTSDLWNPEKPVEALCDFLDFPSPAGWRPFIWVCLLCFPFFGWFQLETNQQDNDPLKDPFTFVSFRGMPEGMGPKSFWSLRGMETRTKTVWGKKNMAWLFHVWISSMWVAK